MCTAHDLGLRLHLNSRFCANWLFVRDLRFRGEVPWALGALYFFATLTGVAEQKKKRKRKGQNYDIEAAIRTFSLLQGPPHCRYWRIAK